MTGLPAHTLDRLTAATQCDGRAPSVVLAAGRDGERLLFTAHGENPVPTAETQYRIGSITKTFTAALIMQLRDAGRLELEHRLDRYLPEIGCRTPTIRQLLTHTSGLQAEPDGPWWERNTGITVDELLAGVTREKWALPPGRHRHYSNLGFALLGAVVERSTGQPWRSAVKSRVLDPVGLHDTTATPRNPYATGYLVHPWQQQMRTEPIPDTQAMAPAGQLWSTADDLVRWGAVLAGGHPDVLDPATAEEMRTLAAIVDPDQWTLGTGLGIQLNRVGERVYCGHSGSMPGYVACLAVHPESGYATATFANCYTGARVTTLAHNALSAILDTAFEPIEPWRPTEPAPPELAPITGRWWWMGTEITIASRGGNLVDVDGDQVATLEPVAPDVWRYVDGADRGELLQVLRDPDGSVAALDIRTFIFTRDPWPANPR